LSPIKSLPSQVSLTEKTKEIIQRICQANNCQFVIVSGRDKDYMERQFITNDLNVSLGACHGAYLYDHKTNEWINLAPHDSTKWKESVIEVFKLYSSRTPGSFFEDKGHAVAWHYRNSPKEFAEFLANKLYLELEETLKSQPVIVTKGKKVIEVRTIHASKGLFVQQWLQNAITKPDIVIALGDDTTDEDMFLVLDEQTIPHFCIRVGAEKTNASYYIKEQSNVNLFLNQFHQSLGT